MRAGMASERFEIPASPGIRTYGCHPRVTGAGASESLRTSIVTLRFSCSSLPASRATITVISRSQG